MEVIGRIAGALVLLRLVHLALVTFGIVSP